MASDDGSGGCIDCDDPGIPTQVFAGPLPEARRPIATAKVLEATTLWRDAVLSVCHSRRRIVLGEAASCDVRLAGRDIFGSRFVLADRVDDEHEIRIVPGMTVEVLRPDGTILDAAALETLGCLRQSAGAKKTVRTFRIGLADRVAVQIGPATVVLQYVRPGARLPESLWSTIDLYFTKILSLSLLAHAMLLAAVVLTPLTPGGLTTNLGVLPSRFAKVLLEETRKPPKKPTFVLVPVEAPKPALARRDKQPLVSGQRDAPRINAHKHAYDVSIAHKAGLLGVLGGEGGVKLAALAGPLGQGTGLNNALSQLRGGADTEASGTGGMGTRTSGPGTGGTSLGIGGLGEGAPFGRSGLGDPSLDGREHMVTGPRAGGNMSTRGCLSREAVGRVIARYHSNVRFCYETELQRDPNLSGKITTVFTIGPAGRVQSMRVAESTMNDAAVEACLLRTIKRMIFPPCLGGGTAEVTYPWFFKSVGQ